MIKIGVVTNDRFMHDTMQDCLKRFMTENGISDDDVINLERDHRNPLSTLHIYYKEAKEF